MGDQETATAALRMARTLHADRPTVMSDPRSGTSASIAAHGEFDLHTANLIASAIAAAVDGGARRVVVNLRQATLLDCATLQAVMRAAAPLSNEPDAGVVLTGATGIVQRFLDLVGVGPLIALARPRDDAIALLRSASPDRRLREITP